MKRIAIAPALFTIFVLVTFFAWRSVAMAIVDPAASNWLVPMGWFSLFAFGLGLGALLIKQQRIWLIWTGVALATSFWFAFSLSHGLFFAVAALFLWRAHTLIRHELEERIHVDIIRSLQAGFPKIIFAVALLIASVYYQQIEHLSWGEWRSEFLVTREGVTSVAGYVARLNPTFRSLQQEDVTVDDFLAEAYQTKIDSIQKDVLPDESLPAELSALSLWSQGEAPMVEGRAYLSSIVGREVLGSESMANVLTESVNARMLNFLPQDENTRWSELFPFFLSIILFFSLLPIGNILARVWMIILKWIVAILLRLHIVRLEKESLEVERMRLNL